MVVLSLNLRKTRKLSSQLSGPFKIVVRVGPVTYELQSPGNLKIQMFS